MEQINEELEERVYARVAHLIQSEEKFAKAFIQSPIAIAIITLEDGQFIEANDACCQLLEYTPFDLINKTKAKLGIWLRPEDWAKILKDIQTHGVAQAREVYLKSQSGRLICAEISARLILLDGTLRLLFVGNDISDRKQFEKYLQAALQEKEALLKEVHHRVKNNLHVIANLLDLQSDYIHDEEVLAIFADSQMRIQTMALIHEQLYQTKDLGQIDFGAYVRRLTENLMLSYSEGSTRIHPIVAIHSMHLNQETAIPCGLLINELVTNALKHAFPNQASGRVYIGLEQDQDGYLQLEIWDDGIGIDTQFNPKKTASFGWKLIQILTRQLKAEMAVESTQGASFRFRFRELSYKTRV